MKSDDRKQSYNSKQIEEKVISVIASFIGDSAIPVNRGTDLVAVYDLDSLESVALILDLEDKFDISVPNEDADKLFKTRTNEYSLPYICSAPVSGFVDYVTSKLLN